MEFAFFFILHALGSSGPHGTFRRTSVVKPLWMAVMIHGNSVTLNWRMATWHGISTFDPMDQDSFNNNHHHKKVMRNGVPAARPCAIWQKFSWNDLTSTQFKRETITNLLNSNWVVTRLIGSAKSACAVNIAEKWNSNWVLTRLTRSAKSACAVNIAEKWSAFFVPLSEQRSKPTKPSILQVSCIGL